MDAWLGPAFIAVVISSLITVIGWFMGLRHDRVLESDHRRERIEDLQTAILADIRSTRHRFDVVDLDEHERTILTKIRGSDGSYTPFVPRESGSLLWGVAASEIHILPTEVIEPVVLFFSQLESARLLVDDLKTDRFAALDQERKAAIYADYISVLRYLVELAGAAENALKASLEVSINSRASGRSSRSAA